MVSSLALLDTSSVTQKRKASTGGIRAPTRGSGPRPVVDGYNEAALPAPSPMKIAAIDIGSNSIHMVVVEVTGSGGFEVVEREKQIERRGAGTLARGPARLLVARA